jgi:hypothetical protein
VYSFIDNGSSPVIQAIQNYRDLCCPLDDAELSEGNAYFRPVNSSSIVAKNTPGKNHQGLFTCVWTSQKCRASATVRVHVRKHVDALWPLLGIVIQSLIISLIILIAEIRRRKKKQRVAAEAEERRKRYSSENIHSIFVRCYERFFFFNIFSGFNGKNLDLEKLANLERLGSDEIPLFFHKLAYDEIHI